MITLLLFFSFGTIVLVSLLLWGVFFWLGARWARVPGVTLGKAVLAGAGVTVASWGFRMLPFLLFSSALADSELLSLSIQLIGGVLVSLLVLKTMFRATLGRLVMAWLPTLIGGAIMLAITFLVFRPYIYEAYVVPTNAMAPTILGHHWTGKCPRCGAPTYASGLSPYELERMSAKGPDLGTRVPLIMICSRERKACEVTDAVPDPESADRIMVCKFLKPQRWDLVVFRYPAEPDANYVKRLVGLPGETVVIRDGAVWIDGQKQTPPPELAGQEYLDQIPAPSMGPLSGQPMPIRWGSAANPARLGPDDYFMLGDFSAQSADSRLWESGAPGHPPYAVPRDHLIGVVTHIYWPRSRWRAFK